MKRRKIPHGSVYTPNGLCFKGSENIKELSAVPWGTREQVLGNEYERFWTDGLHVLVAMPVREPSG